MKYQAGDKVIIGRDFARHNFPKNSQVLVQEIYFNNIYKVTKNGVIKLISESSINHAATKRLHDSERIVKSITNKRVVKPIIDRIEIIVTDRNEIYIKKNGHQIFTTNIYVRNMTCSCGVSECRGVCTLEKIIRLKVKDPYSVLKETLKKFYQTVKKNKASGFLVFSNNQKYPNVNNALDELSLSKTPWKRNPNTDNLIRVWVL